MNIKRNVGRLIGAGTTAAIVAVLSVGTAYADPDGGATDFRQIPMVGSDTTEEVINANANDGAALAISGVKKVASYNATGSANISTSAASGCTFARPNGSSGGRTALINALTSTHATFGCLKGSRSSSLNQATTPNQLTYIPFATENVTFAVRGASLIALDQPQSELQKIWTCDPSWAGIKAMLPQAGSGSRDYWMDKMYGNHNTLVGTGKPVSEGGCVQDGKDENNVNIQEHDGGQVNKNTEVSFYSVSQWVSQTADVITNKRGTTRLGQINSQNPFGATFPIQRDLYNVFPTSLVDQASPAGGSDASVIQQLFVGATSKMCTSTLVLRYGLTKAATCGSTALDTA